MNGPVEFLNDIKRRIIVAILADDELGESLVLKGGNLLQFAYEISYRASRDIDISIDGDFELGDLDTLSKKIQTCLVSAFEEKNLAVFDFSLRKVPAILSDELENFWGGYNCEFKLIDALHHEAFASDAQQMRRRALEVDIRSSKKPGSKKFTIDFSRHEFCEEKEEFEIDGYTIFGYSPRMFAAEKIRAICQQMDEYAVIVKRGRPSALRARDFLDIHIICDHYGIDFRKSEFQEIVKKTFSKKKVPLNLIGKIAQYRDYHEPDFESVKDTVHPGFEPESFGFYFDSLCRKCQDLESLWNE